MPRRGESIYKRKDGRWEGRYIKGYSTDGKAQYASIYRKTYAEVKKALLVQKKQNYLLSIPATELYFTEAASIWLERKSIEVKASTYSHYCYLIHTYIFPALGNKKVTAISTDQIRLFIENQLKHGKITGNGGLSPKTVADILIILKGIFAYLDENYHVPNPCLHLKAPRECPKTIEILTEDEQAKLEKYLLESLNCDKLGILLCLFTGLRLGEICSLRWNDIQLPSGHLHVQRTVQRITPYPKRENKTKLVISSPKTTSSNRILPLPDFLTALVISVYNKEHPDFFLTTNQPEPMDPRTYQYYFKKVLHECEIPSKNFHILRHTFSSRCIETGFDIKSLSEILGHNSVQMTLNRYVHSSFEYKKQQMNLLTVHSSKDK